MKKYVLMFWLIYTSAYCLDFDSIKKNYPNIFKGELLEIENRKLFLVSVMELDSANELSSIINSNNNVIDYLFTHFVSYNYDQLKEVADSNKRNELLVNGLLDDTVFTKNMYSYFSPYFDTKSNKKDTFSLDRAAQIASKFFYITNITEDGHFNVKICIGINGIAMTEPKRYPLLEAFVYSFIMENLDNEQFSLKQEMIENIQKITLHLGNDKSDATLRAQGILFYLMYRNEKLRNTLFNEFERQKEYLPFVIKK